MRRAKTGAVIALAAIWLCSGCGIESGGEIKKDAGTGSDGQSGTDTGGNCQDDCVAGQQFCDGSGYRTCGNYDNDTCVEWSQRIECPSGSCQDGECADGCIDQCAALSRQCVGSTAYQTCADYNQDGCLEWGTQTACEANLICDQGYCVTDCASECSDGDLRCAAMGDGVETCGNYDTDSCLEFGGFVACAANQVCLDGECVMACSDECNFAERRCVAGIPAYEVCADHDADGCTEWGGQSSCGQDQLCDVNTGECYDEGAYPPGPYGTGLGDTIANECFERCLCTEYNLDGAEEFCFEDFLGARAILVPVSTGW
jgi:hypothetical protein